MQVNLNPAKTKTDDCCYKHSRSETGKRDPIFSWHTCQVHLQRNKRKCNTTFEKDQCAHLRDIVFNVVTGMHQTM